MKASVNILQIQYIWYFCWDFSWGRTKNKGT